MRGNLALVAVATVFALSLGYAQQQTVKVAPISSAPVTDGKQMFMNNCAPCHGVNGRGDGPVAASLNVKPANLALLARNHGGKFPFAHVTSVLEFGTENAAHGTAAMPVWGPIFSQADPRTTKNGDRTLRINNLARYIESIQDK